MKNFFTKTTLILFSLFIFSVSNAQTFPYFLEVETDTYTDLEEATELTSIGDLWDDPEYIVPIGFEFDFYGEPFNEIRFIGVGAILSFQDPNITNPLNVLIPYLDDIIDIENINPNMQSTISHTTEGIAGSQIFKLEWKDCGFYGEIDSLNFDNILSFQLWLYEGSNDIEFRYGPSAINNFDLAHEFGTPSGGIIEGLNSDNEDFTNFWHLRGDPTMPVIDSADASIFNTYDLPGLDTDPAEGQVYRLTTIPTSINVPTQNLALNVYPTVVTDKFFVEVSEELLSKKTQISVVNNLGQVIYNNTITTMKEQLNASNFPAGIYYVRINNENGIGTKKIIKN